MKLSINAWLERRDPRICLIDADSGDEVFRLESEQVRELMDTGDLCLFDFKERSYPCLELLALLKERMVLQRDPTWLRMPSYIGSPKAASQRSTLDSFLSKRNIHV